MEQNITRLFHGAQIDPFRPIKIKTNDHTYTIKPVLTDNWLYHAIVGFKEHRKTVMLAGNRVRTAAMIGTSNGADAIAASIVFPELEQIMLVDSDQRVLPVAKVNASRYCISEVVEQPGDYCRPLIEQGIKVDLIYINIPNLPVNGVNLNKGINLATFYDQEHSSDVPDRFKRYLLANQYECLSTAKHCLTPTGAVLLMIGGRVPPYLLRELVEEFEMDISQVVCGFKRQTEAEETISGYAKAEKNGVEFGYYSYLEGMTRFCESGMPNPSPDCRGGGLQNDKISATKALELHKKGIEIGHTVHLLAGKLQ